MSYLLNATLLHMSTYLLSSLFCELNTYGNFNLLNLNIKVFFVEKYRINFKSNVPDILYRRAGGRCSVPRCKNPTMGPYYGKSTAANLGEACHIYSASENGPRGWGGNTAEFIASENNGIWCCAYHASLIDKNDGNDYPAAKLFSWKNLAEARTLKQMNDEPSPLGWVSTIEFISYENLTKPPMIELSHKTFIHGPNCSGKTSLMEACASIVNSKYGENFNYINGGNESFGCKARITYTTVDALDKNVVIELVDGVARRFEDGRECLLPPGDIAVIFCSSRDLNHRHNEDDIDFLTRFLNIDKSSLFSLLKNHERDLIKGDVRFERAFDYDDENDREIGRKKPDEEPYMELQFRHAGRPHWVPYETLATSEKSLLLLDLAVAAAQEISKQRLTLFLLDGLDSNFDPNNFRKLISCLSNVTFQVLSIVPVNMEHEVLARVERAVSSKELDYLESWNIVKLSRSSRHFSRKE